MDVEVNNVRRALVLSSCYCGRQVLGLLNCRAKVFLKKRIKCRCLNWVGWIKQRAILETIRKRVDSRVKYHCVLDRKPVFIEKYLSGLAKHLRLQRFTLALHRWVYGLGPDQHPPTPTLQTKGQSSCRTCFTFAATRQSPG